MCPGEAVLCPGEAPTPRTRPRALAGAALLAVATLAAAGCASATVDDSPGVSGPFGKKPAITIPDLKPPKKARMKILLEGNGPVVRKGQVAVTHVGMMTWENRKPMMNTYDLQQPTTVAFDGEHVARTWDQALIGRKGGSRVLMVTPATSGFGPHGMAPAQVKPTDHMVLVFDLIGGYDPAQQVPAPAPGSTAGAAADAGAPVIKVAKGQEPQVEKWGSDAPTAYAARTLVPGNGAELRKGDSVVVQYTGWEWGKKDPFGSTYRISGPNGFTVNDKDALLPGWFAALNGAKVGSRIAIHVPAKHKPGFTATSGGVMAPRDKPVLYVLDVLDRRAG
ncbi:peptidylprolyl isomerase [Streptomyces spiroverticillatus]|uniref:peptidylprolyl isomerase n=1 Tax=Streptomyces finlayi TaxID=67296 RepID=A0A918WU63_9ACTN|nr:FKBP-type peptidyl-prolyl cis-trans isomerase [Streptomyces finlayi]GGZ98640.1 peptidylprolyl isomerase [Streptomyces spiroverticillatus]GHC83519.1 peptidylprolyl isomerase [Streptomyces finlayi]